MTRYFRDSTGIQWYQNAEWRPKDCFARLPGVGVVVEDVVGALAVGVHDVGSA